MPVSPAEHVESPNQKFAPVLTELKVHDLNIKPHRKHALIGVIDRWFEAFEANEDDIGHTTEVEHSIKTGDALPIKERLRLIPHHRRHIAEKELDRYLRLDIVRTADPVKCPWSVAIVLVNKKR